MAFNLEASIKAVETDLVCNKLFLLLAGPTGGGKSGTAATTGVKTLYLYAGGENHGPKSAQAQLRIMGQNPKKIVPLSVSIDEKGKPLSDDDTYKRTLEILKATDQIKAGGFGCVVIDGLTELESFIIETGEWNAEVTEQYKGNKSYAGPVTIRMFRKIIAAAKELQRQLDIHIIMTAIMDVKSFEDDGTINEGELKLKGFDVITFLVPQFDDRLFVSHMTDGESQPLPRLQMAISITKTTSDFKTKVLRKTFKVRPRLMGVDMATMPDSVKADLSRIIAYKEAGKFFKEEPKK